MREQIHIFLHTIMFYTRIPIPWEIPYSDKILNRTTRYFPLVGLFIGAVGAGAYALSLLVFPPIVALLLSMATTILLTGAFHEDGFADFCDGFGGGYMSPERVLGIMKDSRLGTYGAIGLVFMLATKFISLNALCESKIIPALIIGHTLSRLMPVFIIFTTAYSRTDGKSKTKPIGKKGKYSDLIFAMLIPFASLLYLPWQISVVSLVVLLAITFLFGKYLLKRLGGYTGDCLGALQQISEVAFYLVLLASQTYLP